MKILSKSRKAVYRIYDLVDVLSEQLCRMDPYWKKCFPCNNNGICCKNVDIPLYGVEWVLVSEYLRNLLTEDVQMIQNNLRNNIKCPFRLSSKCAVHSVRPLYCRITPFYATYHEQSTEIEVMYPSKNCTFVRQRYLRVTDRMPQLFERLGERYFIVLSEVIGKSPEMRLLESSGKQYLSQLLDNFCHINIL
ncbi:YkgJ family cysteine cluster protein [Desulfolucanica intricata]|uniref:YkgJ family cysteine cluster protein n=1 Tax=Desulfolucanica intricata TaxID=1285191 RepID=UPI000834B7BD|nr:YkgJ family cysteine cluster protein [Desulfolucanica intricata]